MKCTRILAIVTAGLAATAPALAARKLEHKAVIAAPVAEVWSAFTTKEGAESWLAPHVEFELRIGGEMRTNYHADGRIGDENTIINRILSLEPQRMLSIQNVQAPAGFAHADLFQQAWHVIYFEPLSADRTRVRIVGLGYGEGTDWDQIFNKFDAGNAYTLDSLRRKFEPVPGSAEPSDVLDVLARLVGGEWIFENARPDGSLFRGRAVWEKAPDGRSIVAAAWLGDADGMFLHGATQVWREPPASQNPRESGLPGEVRFQSINEQGAIARGSIRAAASDALEWDWNSTAPDGKTTQYRVLLKLDQPDHYDFSVSLLGDGHEVRELVHVQFRRVDKAPEAFLKIRLSN